MQQAATYQGQIQKVFLRIALGPVFDGLVLGQIVPCMATIIVLESPAGVVRFALDTGLLRGSLIAVVCSLARCRAAGLAARCSRHGSS